MDQAAEAEIKQMRAKVEKTEQGQQQIMGFLTQAVNNPAFLHQLLNARQSNNRVTEEGSCSSAVTSCLFSFQGCKGEYVFALGRYSAAPMSHWCLKPHHVIQVMWQVSCLCWKHNKVDHH